MLVPAMLPVVLRSFRVWPWRALPMVLPLLLGAQAFFAKALRAQPLMTAADLGTLTASAPTATIAYGAGPLQFGKLRLPATPGPHPVVILVHGGCWLSAYDIAHVGAMEQALADSGMAVWSLEYRRVGDAGGGWPGTFSDLGQGADFLRTLATQYPLDLSRVVAAGHSAGGAAALWLAARTDRATGTPLAVPDPLPVQAVVALAPAADLEDLQASRVCGGVVERLMGGTPAAFPERYAAVSPMRFPRANVPQWVVIGAQDALWGPGGRAYAAQAQAQTQAQATGAQAQGAQATAPVQLVELPQSGHFEMINPASSSWPAVLAAFRAAVAATRDTTVAEVRGRVVNDQTDQPLAGVEVRLRGMDQLVRTDSRGQFRIAAPAGRQVIVLAKPGHRPFSAEVVSSRGAAPEYVLGLVPSASSTLAPVMVAATMTDRRLASFEEHRRAGIGGHFLPTERFADEIGRSLADVLVTVPGADIVRGKGGAAFYASRRGYDTIRNTVKVSAADRGRGAAVGTCYAAVMLNGVFVYRGDEGEQLFDLHALAPADILAMEIYNGGATMPLEYNAMRNSCGLVVIWTR